MLRFNNIALSLLFTLLFSGACAGCSDKTNAVKEPLPSPTVDSLVVHTGHATFYTFADGGGACMFDPTPGDLMVGAINPVDYCGSCFCGACAEVTGMRGTIRIRIVDLCPGCPQGSIDLSPIAFSQIADTSLGIVPITWHLVSCAVTGPINYHFKDGSNQWWTAVQIRNHRNPIRSFEYRTAAQTFKPVSRTDYNYFVETSGMGPGPYVFRVTDIYDHVLIDSAVALTPDGTVTGRAQFPQ